ncbi:MAG TPA: pyridoxal-phosphate dependent enzyme, partial [Thermoanaerobaculia bacterium]|nr:pyridoxal-phosphate dependent enzyme [Thermoanaerobaculia bacterium]
VGLEVLEDAPETDLVLVAIGGGGLISGISSAVKGRAPGVRVVGVEPVGAANITESLRAGRVVELPEVTTAANTLAPRRSHEMNFEIIRKNWDDVVLVSDEEMFEAARWLWFEMGIAAELSGAAAVAAVLTGKVPLNGVRSACAIVCGAGTAGLSGN